MTAQQIVNDARKEASSWGIELNENFLWGHICKHHPTLSCKEREAIISTVKGM